MNRPYLTDDELTALILDIETADMTAAPPDLADNILAALAIADAPAEQTVPLPAPAAESDVPAAPGIPTVPDSAPRPPLTPKRRRQLYYRYCLQVTLAAAAAIWLVLSGPQHFRQMRIDKAVISQEEDPRGFHRADSDEEEDRGNALFSRLGSRSSFFSKTHYLFTDSEVNS